MAAHGGDPLPGSVARFLASFGAGDAASASACFAADGLYAFPGDPDEERGARLAGAEEQRLPVLARDPALGRRHGVRICVVAGSDCLLEGWIEEAGGPRSFAASVELDGEGLIARWLCFRCELVEEVAEPSPAAAGEPPPADAQAQVDGYFEELEAGEFAAAVEYFSAGCLYSHPPYAPGLPRAEFRGHAELQAGFEKRGKLSKRHFILAKAQRGRHHLLEGLVWLEGTAEGRNASFMSSVTLDPDGRILRYVAFVCEPAVARRRSR